MNNEQQYKDKREWLSITSLCLGIASIFLWEFSIVPILAIIFGGVGLFRDKNKWLAAAGITLGIVFLVVRISQGHMDGIFSNTYSSNAVSQTSSVPTTPASASASSDTASSRQTAAQEQATCERVFGANAYLRNASTGYCGYRNDPTNELLVPPGVVPPSSQK